jgi:hypothetical protein
MFRPPSVAIYRENQHIRAYAVLLQLVNNQWYNVNSYYNNNQQYNIKILLKLCK